MANSRAKEVSESYKGSEITFDKTTAGAVAKGYAATTVQGALEEAKPVASTQTVAGIARNATDVEAANGAGVLAYVRPDQVANKIAVWTVAYINANVIPLIPPAVTLPTITYGGQGSADQMVAIYNGLPAGSFVVFDEYYTYVVGWGNGSSTVGAYRRRTITKTNNAGWQFLHFA